MNRDLRIAVLGRTEMLLSAARLLADSGFKIVLVATSAPSENYLAAAEDFEAFARDASAAFHRGTNLKSHEAKEKIAEAAPDFAVSMNWPGILNKETLEAFPLGVFNAHPGDLPRYRGNACPNWAILNGESHIAACVHEMTEELDAGPIAERSELKMSARTDIEDVYLWLRDVIPHMFLSLACKIETNRLSLTDQPTDPLLSLRCFPRRPEDSQISWDQSAEQISRLVRASTRPFGGAFCFFGQTVLRVWKAELFHLPYPILAVPGQVLFAHEGHPVIATSDGALKLLEITIDGEPSSAANLITKNLRNRLV